MEKLFIKNRKGLKVAVIVDETENQKGLVFLMHGLLGFKEQSLLIETAKIFKENNFTTVSFDTTNGIGESDGVMEELTITGYSEDLEDVINWSKSQKFYSEPFILVGHSWGGYCVGNYAADNSNIESLILYSPVVSGASYQEIDKIKQVLKNWKEGGIREWESQSNPGVVKRLKYQFIKDSLNHDLLKNAEKINCPVLIIRGDEDASVPLAPQETLFNKIITKKEFFIIRNGDHDLEKEENLMEIHNIINKWIKD